MGRTTKTLGLSAPTVVVGVQRDRNNDQWIDDLIEEAKAEQANSPMDVEALLKESDRLASYGAQQAKRLGIKAADVSRIIHEHREVQRA